MKALTWVVVGLVATAACEKPKEAPATGEPSMKMDSGGMQGMPGMGKGGMMAMMQAHTDSMMRMTPEQMSGMMASHDRMMSQMMDQMGSDMRQMKMGDMPEWSALTDSVRQDLAELPGLKGPALSARVQAHAGRVRRLIGAHEKMMKEMQ